MTTAGVEAKFTNTRKLGDLTISKKIVSARPADHTEAYGFTVTLTKDGEIYELTQTFKTTAGGEVKFENGQATVEVKGGESVTIKGLPQGISYIVTETDAKGMKPEDKGATGTITETTHTAAFTNTRENGKRTEPGKATVSKVDEQGAALEGATFQLFEDEELMKAVTGATYSEQRFTISTEDEALASYLPEPDKSVTLYLMETVAPANRVKMEKPFAVVISAKLTHALEKNVYMAITKYNVTIDGKAVLTVPNPLEKVDVEVRKVYGGVDKLPKDFRITNDYNDDAFTVDNALSGTGTAASPYRWTIKDVPVGKKITFTETGAEIKGYSLTATASPVGGVVTATLN